MRSIKALGALTLACAAPSVVAQSAPAAAPARPAYIAYDTATIVLKNATVIDGTGAPAKPGQSIVIAGGKITAVGAAKDVKPPAGAVVLDMSGKTVIPGIVGLHDHMYYAGRTQLATYPRLFLASGVTTIRTTGSIDPYQELNLADAIRSGRVPGPEVIPTGPYLEGKNGLRWARALNTPDDARRVVKYWSEEGITWFKAYTQITNAELAAAIDEAHKHGMKVTAHLCSVGFRDAVADGIDNLEHGLFVDTEFWPGKQPDVCPTVGDSVMFWSLDINSADVKRTIQEMVSKHVAMTSTLAVFEVGAPSRIPLDERVYAALAPDVATRVRAWYDTAQHKNDTATRVALKKAMQFERAFVAAGGLLGAGSDPCCVTEIAGYGDQRNFELLVEAGFTPEQAIQIMTLNGAKVLSMADRTGSIAVGKQADLVVLDGNPVANARDIRNVSLVFRQGIGYDPKALLAPVLGNVGR